MIKVHLGIVLLFPPDQGVSILFSGWSLQIWVWQDRVADDLERQGVVEQKQPGGFQIRSMCPPVALPVLSEL